MEASCDFICHKINRSVETIAKLRYYISRHLLLIYIMHLFLLIHGICAWGNFPRTYLSNILVLQKRALHLIYFSRSRGHAMTFFFLNQTAFLCRLCIGVRAIFCQGGGVNRLPKKFLQVAQMFTKPSNRNEGHTMQQHRPY